MSNPMMHYVLVKHLGWVIYDPDGVQQSRVIEDFSVEFPHLYEAAQVLDDLADDGEVPHA